MVIRRMEMVNAIKEKIKTLSSQREQIIAQLNAVSGAIQALKDVLAESETAEKEDNADD